MKTCKTCKHWIVPEDKDFQDYRVYDICSPLDQDTYDPMKMDFEVRVCSSPLIIRFERPQTNTGIALTDGSGCWLCWPSCSESSFFTHG